MNILHSHNLLFVVRSISAIIALAISAGCSGKGGEKHEAPPPPASVIVAEVTQKTVPIYSEFVGQTRADETVELRARVEGVLQKVYFKEGWRSGRVNCSSPSTSARSRPPCSLPKHSPPKPFRIWRKRNNEPTFSRLRPNWPKPRPY